MTEPMLSHAPLYRRPVDKARGFGTVAVAVSAVCALAFFVLSLLLARGVVALGPVRWTDALTFGILAAVGP